MRQRKRERERKREIFLQKLLEYFFDRTLLHNNVAYATYCT